MRDGLRAPIKIWLYRGWCAICVPCNKAIAIDAQSQPDAMALAWEHIGEHRRNRSMPTLRRVSV